MKTAPIHKKLAAHREEPSVEKLKEIVDEHHSDFPPAFVWAPDLLLVIEKMQNEINELKKQVNL